MINHELAINVWALIIITPLFDLLSWKRSQEATPTADTIQKEPDYQHHFYSSHHCQIPQLLAILYLTNLSLH